MDINIDNKNYEIIDTKEKITVPDCVVWSTNKIWTAHWESKIYLWNEWEETFSFFWNRGFKIKCIIKKEDLLKYLDDIKDEYFMPSLPYGVAYNDKQNEKRKIKKDLPKMSDLWEERRKELNKLDDYIYFEFDDQPQIDPPRVYVNTDSLIIKLLRQISLPHVTYLASIKLRNDKWEIYYYFRLFVDYFDEYENPYFIEKEEKEVMEDKEIDSEEKKQVIRARKWQWKYRQLLLEQCPICPITLISDDRLLIASHIKPWAKSDIKEKTDPKNGFMLTPTYDLLFDRGFITFTDNKKIIISPWLSKMTCSKLNISPDKQYTMLPTEWRENYLEYHRNYIFKN